MKILFTPKNGKPYTIQLVDNTLLTINPGFNDIPDEVWESIKVINSDLIAPMIENETIVIVKAEVKPISATDLLKERAKKTKPTS